MSVDAGIILELFYDGTDWVVMGNPDVMTHIGENEGYIVKASGLIIQRFRDGSENNPQTFVFPILYTHNSYMIVYSSTYLRVQQIITQSQTMCQIMQYGSINSNNAMAAPIHILTIGF